MPDINTGLSPLVRGKLSKFVILLTAVGSIPACAGETDVFCRDARARGVYPRLCGGNELDGVEHIISPGLSPLVRGKRWDILNAHDWTGSIPACAGETQKKWISVELLGVYPRLCGGNSCIQHYDLLKKNGFSILIC